jgi:plasmid stabilization system protein ParE
VIWTANALANLSRLRDFLIEKSPGAARRAIAAIREGVRTLEQFPQAGRLVEDEGGDVRDWIIHFGREGYKVRYRNEDGRILILAVRHMREAEPREDSGRLKPP